MFVPVPPGAWSNRALKAGIFSLSVAIFLAIADGVFRGATHFPASGTGQTYLQLYMMLEIWCYNLRNVADVMLEVSAIVFVGAKFLEMRSLFTVGFDRLDASKIAFKGPDENNTLWIGQRYASKFEAETVGAAIAERLKDGAQ